MWFGVSQTGPAVFALPGNPVSTLVCLSRYVLPALRAAMGQAPAEAPRIAHHRAGGGQGAARFLHAGEAARATTGAARRRSPAPPMAPAISPRSPAPTDSSNCRPGPTRFRKGSWRGSTAGEHESWTCIAKSRRARPPGISALPVDTLRRADPRPAHLGHGSLQLPLPVLHAARDLPRVTTGSSKSNERLDFAEIAAARARLRARRREEAAHHRRRAAAARRISRISSAISPRCRASRTSRSPPTACCSPSTPPSSRRPDCNASP